jgi:hypothetical protein
MTWYIKCDVQSWQITHLEFDNNRSRVGLKPIGPIAPNWAPYWSYLLSAVQVHITTHRRFYREQLGLGLPKSCPKSLARLSEGTGLNMIFKTLPDILSFCCNNDLRVCRKITPMFQCTTYHLKVNRSSFERTTNAFFVKIKDNWVVFQALNVKTHMENDPLIIRMILFIIIFIYIQK